MSLETQAQVQQEGWWPIAAHILKRLLLVVLAYLVAVLVTLIGVVIIYSVLSNLPAAPDYFAWFNWAPLVGILAPFAAGFIYMLALMISAVPTLLAAIVTEGLGLRQVWLHALLGAVVAGRALPSSRRRSSTASSPPTSPTSRSSLRAGFSGERPGG